MMGTWGHDGDTTGTCGMAWGHHGDTGGDTGTSEGHQELAEGPQGQLGGGSPGPPQGPPAPTFTWNQASSVQ